MATRFTTVLQVRVNTTQSTYCNLQALTVISPQPISSSAIEVQYLGKGCATGLRLIAVWIPYLHQPQQALAPIKDFRSMILVLPLPQRMSFSTQMSFSTPTLLYTTNTTRALRQVRLVLLILKGLSTPARVAIILAFDINTLVLNAQISHKALCWKMLSALQFSRYAEPSGARMATPTLALSLIPLYS